MAFEPEKQLGHCFSHNLHSHFQKWSAVQTGIAHHHYNSQYFFANHVLPHKTADTTSCHIKRPTVDKLISLNSTLAWEKHEERMQLHFIHGQLVSWSKGKFIFLYYLLATHHHNRKEGWVS